MKTLPRFPMLPPKPKGAEEIGMHEETIRLPANTSEEEVLKIVDKLNKDPKFHGILVQLPCAQTYQHGQGDQLYLCRKRCGWLSSGECRQTAAR